MKKLLFILVLVIVALGNLAWSSEDVYGLTVNMGRSANYHTKPSFDSDDRNIWQSGLVIFDYDAVVNSPEEFAQAVRQKLPTQKFLIYINCAETFEDQNIYQGRPLQKKLYQEALDHPEYFLKDTAGSDIVYWTRPRMRLMNFTSQCPTIEGQNWLDRCSAQLKDFFRDYGQDVDGIMIDNLFDNWTWMVKQFAVGLNFDADRNLLPDPKDSINLWGKEGYEKLLQRLRSDLPSKIIVGNGMNRPEAYPERDGAMAEDFPNKLTGGWYATMNRYHQYCQKSRYSILHTVSPSNYRLTICSALLENGYYALGQDVSVSLPQIELGPPVETALNPYGRQAGDYDDNLWYRHYQKATVVVNPTAEPASFLCSGRKISIPPLSGCILDNQTGADLLKEF